MNDLLNSAPCGYLAFAEDGTIVMANHTLSRWLGYMNDELAGKSIESIFNLATRIFYNTHFFPLLKLHTKAEEIFISLQTKDRNTIPVITTAESRTEDGVMTFHCVFVPVRQRAKYEDEILQAKREAESALRENKHLAELKAALEHRSLELDQQYQKLLTMNQNLVQFSKIVSHDLQEPLRKIQIFSDIVVRHDKESLSDKSKTAIQKIHASVERLRVLTSGLHQYVSLDSDDLIEDVDLNVSFNAARSRAVQHRQFDAIHFECDDLPIIQGYKAQLELLFFHLIDNAIQFRKQSERLKIQISGILLEDNMYKMTNTRYKFVGHLRLSISDNGIGFDNAFKEHVFELLTRLGPPTGGLGIGLSLVKKIVENHFGVLTVNSEKDLGTTFTITLPLKIHSQTSHNQV